MKWLVKHLPAPGDTTGCCGSPGRHPALCYHPQVQGAGSDTAPCRQTATATCLFLHPCGSHLGRRSSQRPRDALVPVALGCRLKAEASSAPLHQITRTCTDLPLAVFIPPMAHILHKSTHAHSHVLASCVTTEPWWHSTAAGPAGGAHGHPQLQQHSAQVHGMERRGSRKATPMHQQKTILLI